jgi:hypothetical protein
MSGSKYRLFFNITMIVGERRLASELIMVVNTNKLPRSEYFGDTRVYYTYIQGVELPQFAINKLTNEWYLIRAYYNTDSVALEQINYEPLIPEGHLVGELHHINTIPAAQMAHGMWWQRTTDWQRAAYLVAEKLHWKWLQHKVKGASRQYKDRVVW